MKTLLVALVWFVQTLPALTADKAPSGAVGCVVFKRQVDAGSTLAEYRSYKDFGTAIVVIDGTGGELRVFGSYGPLFIPYPSDPAADRQKAIALLQLARKTYPDLSRRLASVEKAWTDAPLRTAPTAAVPQPVVPQPVAPPPKNAVVGTEIVTTSGARYSNARVTSVVGDLLTIAHDDGVSRVRVADLPEETKKKYAHEITEGAKASAAEPKISSVKDSHTPGEAPPAHLGKVAGIAASSDASAQSSLPKVQSNADAAVANAAGQSQLTSVLGRLGETAQQCQQRYGTPIISSGSVFGFKKAGFVIVINFFEGKADEIGYRKIELNALGKETEISTNEMEQAKKFIGDGREWKEISLRSSVNREWQTTDGGFYARYKADFSLWFGTKGRVERTKAAQNSAGTVFLKSLKGAPATKNQDARILFEEHPWYQVYATGDVQHESGVYLRIGFIFTIQILEDGKFNHSLGGAITNVDEDNPVLKDDGLLEFQRYKCNWPGAKLRR